MPKIGISNQPCNKIEWVHRDELKANSYNPNAVAPPEMELLKVSILTDGWTFPLVVSNDGEIIDGFHRWTISNEPEIYALTDGFIPIVRVEVANCYASTIRHNRAKGTHGILKMAEIVKKMREQGLSCSQIMVMLGMEDEEVKRLLNRIGMPELAKGEGFNNAWVAG